MDKNNIKEASNTVTNDGIIITKKLYVTNQSISRERGCMNLQWPMLEFLISVLCSCFYYSKTLQNVLTSSVSGSSLPVWFNAPYFWIFFNASTMALSWYNASESFGFLSKYPKRRIKFNYTDHKIENINTIVEIILWTIISPLLQVELLNWDYLVLQENHPLISTNGLLSILEASSFHSNYILFSFQNSCRCCPAPPEELN